MRNKNVKLLIVLLACALIVIGSIFAFDIKRFGAIGDKAAYIYFFDTEKSDAILIYDTQYGSVLIDAGSNQYEKELIDHIQKIGIRKIDYVIATHPHSDHIGGMEYVIQTFDIGKFYTIDYKYDTIDYRRMVDALGKKNIPIEYLYRGDAFKLGNIEFECISPAKNASFKEVNDYSIVLRAGIRQTDFLFMGDLENAGEKTLIESGALKVCDVLKVAHHGSNSSSKKDFLAKVKPEYAVITCGREENGEYVHENVLQRLKNAGVRNIYATGKDGIILFKVTDKKTEVFTGFKL